MANAVGLENISNTGIADLGRPKTARKHAPDRPILGAVNGRQRRMADLWRPAARVRGGFARRLTAVTANGAALVTRAFGPISAAKSHGAFVSCRRRRRRCERRLIDK